jgi:hypothetical protein
VLGVQDNARFPGALRRICRARKRRMMRESQPRVGRYIQPWR